MKTFAFTPIMDQQGIIRLGGRIEQAKLPYENRHPILLPSNHPLTNKLIRAYHEKLLHKGFSTVPHKTILLDHSWSKSSQEDR